MEGRRTYYADEYAALILPAVEATPHRTWNEATSPAAHHDPHRRALLIRHDIDRDLENAVRMARWEAAHGIRATYCVLHTAAYYGRRDEQGRITRRSRRMIEAMQEIQSLGHEVNLHNNAVSYALRTGAHAYQALARELAYLRSHGLNITGTSTHGDPLCHRLGYRNKEMFTETVLPERGGPRVVAHRGRRVRLGARSMRRYGLTYEGYDLPRDLYVSDSGGTLKTITDTAGRGGLRRGDWPGRLPYEHITGLLIHPAWWDLRRTAPAGRPDVSWRSLLA